MKTYVVEVSRAKEGLDHLDEDDRVDLLEIEDNHRIEADDTEAALDIFHSTVAISCLEDFKIEVREAKPLKKFYVSMNWDNYPEGGSYGTKVMAEDWADAERLCRREMAFASEEERGDSDDPDGDAAHFLECYGREWTTVDCYEIEPTKVWCLIHQWEGQKVPDVKPFASKSAAEQAIRDKWPAFRDDCDYNKETPCPEIVVRENTLFCAFDSDEWYWITEATMDVEEDN